MSGGSWNYICFKIEEVAERLMFSSDPMRRALGRKLEPFAKALHDIEWVDSNDYAPGREHEAIREALGDNWNELKLSEIVFELEQLIDKASQALEEVRNEKNRTGN